MREEIEKKEKKKKNNVTVRNASESTRKEKPWNIFLWIFLFLLSRTSFYFSYSSAKLDECKVSVETVRRFRLKRYGIDGISEEYPLFGDSFTLLYIYSIIHSAKTYFSEFYSQFILTHLYPFIICEICTSILNNSISVSLGKY